MSKKKTFSTEKITYIALLVALQVVLGNISQIASMSKQVSLGFVPIAIAGSMMGPVAAMIVGGLGDFFGAHLFPQGAYFIGFTLSNMIVGFIYGYVLHKHKLSWTRVIIATIGVELVHLFLNTLWLSIMYTSKTYWIWLELRAVGYLFEVPFYAVVTYFTLYGLQKIKFQPRFSRDQ
ncbi:MAG: folate family ECF transporter S component [Clostridiales bacterium]|nr:folate family ECF transporter S component [Clostridiales bacterium]